MKIVSNPTEGKRTQAIEALTESGVSIWLDDLSRERISNGNLTQLIERYSVRGVTTNPSIFHNAISSGSTLYRAQIQECAQQGLNSEDTIRLITADDVRAACDIFRGVFEETSGIDGRISIEVDPRLAHDTQGTIEAARDLWSLVDRENLFIKIPATLAGLPAISQVISEGISVNVTLIFSDARYRQVIDAYTTGLEVAQRNGMDISNIQSVASFFISRVDTIVDAQLDAIGSSEAHALRGKIAVANARIAWQTHVEALESARWKSLIGAQVQRPLWASTGVKNPAFSDSKYVVELAAPGCVNTMPEKTLHALLDHDQLIVDTMTDTFSQSKDIFNALENVGVDLPEILNNLEEKGVKSFADSWRDLLGSVDTELKTAAQ